MAGTFSSFSAALSGLQYNRTAMDVASSNIANASSTGYARRQVVAQATGAPATPAIWSRWQGAGDGVEAGRITRLVDPLLDSRSRAEHAAASFLDLRSTSLSTLETSLAEPGDSGVAAALSGYQAAWHDVANNPADLAARSQLLARAQTLRDTIATQGTAVGNEWAGQRNRLDAGVAEVNQVASQLADLNRGLRASSVAGTDAGTLLDQRDVLTARLAELTGAAVTVNADTTVEVSVGGQSLVSGYTATAMTVTGATDIAAAASDPVVVSVGGAPVTLAAGSVGAGQQLLATDLPTYLSALDDVVAALTSTTNAQHAAGLDLDGAAGGDLWTGTTAATLQVAITDPRKVAAAAASRGGLDSSNADLLANLDSGAGSYRNLVTAFAVTVTSARQGAGNQAALVAQIDASRESLSGVSTDEEMVNLLTAQRGYEACARVLTALDSMLDTLIHSTGMVGR